jgi:hypothetical protein
VQTPFGAGVIIDPPQLGTALSLSALPPIIHLPLYPSSHKVVCMIYM